MNEAARMTITLEYRSADSAAWRSVQLQPEQYFELLPGETPGIGGVARHAHGIDYLAADARPVRATRLTLVDRSCGDERVITETFWNEGRNRAIERTDRGLRPDWELILAFESDGAIEEIVRIGRADGIPVPLYHGFMRPNGDGSFTEKKVGLT